MKRKDHVAKARKLSAAGSWALAIAEWKRVVELDAKDPADWVRLALSYAYAGRYPEAVDAFGLAMQHGLPADEVAAGLGVVFCLRQQYDVARENLEFAVAKNPSNLAAWGNLVVACARTGDVARALEAAEIVLARSPRDLGVLGALGSLYKDAALPDEAVRWCERAAAAAPDDPNAISNLLWALLHSDTASAAAILARAREFDRRASRGGAAAELGPRRAPRSEGAPIRVGWLSGDLRNHAVGQFVIPVLEQLDRGRVESIVYATSHFDDAMSARARGAVHAFRRVADRSDAELVALARKDSLDVMIDLAGHTDASRLSALARRVAPVQVSWLGYPGTTGLATIDYVLVPPDPALLVGGWCSETPLALPDVYSVRALAESSAFPASPALPPRMPWRTSGRFTFGCLNNFAKVSPACLRAFARVLVAVPDARLLLVGFPEADRARADDVRARFAEHGVDAGRLDLRARMSFEAYQCAWSELDLALDPFPFNGGTTGFDALFAGVPFLTLRGASLHERMGANLLGAVGLSALAFDATDAYVDAAVRFAREPATLEPLRQRLPDALRASALVDVPRFARGLEQVLAGAVRAAR